MWSGKMAARWKGYDGNVNAGSGTAGQLVQGRHHVEGVEVGTRSCMDQSILAIFEDSTAASEDRNGEEEESETLLSALTEMLDSVEDDDRTLSPFDTLPETGLLTRPEPRDNSGEIFLADRFRPRSKPPNAPLRQKEDKSKKERSSAPYLFKQQQRTWCHSKNKNSEAEVEVFTSTSLINLVKIMHPYCLRLHVGEDGDKLKRNHTFFSQEEVWKYERPTEESDEEINVVSDDEVAVKDPKEMKEGGEKSGKLLKSALLNAKSSREKKRVSFGPVQVASFDESVEAGLNEKNPTGRHTSGTIPVPLNSTEAHQNPSGSADDPQTSSSEMNRNKAEVLPPKGQKKAKSLTLQQYRLRHHKRQPLMEKQGNHTTKWPSVSGSPQELTPILCLQGQTSNNCGPQLSHHYSDGTRRDGNLLHRSHTPGYKTRLTSAPPRIHPSEAKPPTPLHCSRLKRPRTESRTLTPASPLPIVTVGLNVNVPKSKKSPIKKPTLLSSDPPNPVLLPLPVSQAPSPSTDHSSSESNTEFPNRDSNLDSTRHFQEIQSISSGASLQPVQSSLGPNQDCACLFQEIKTRFTERASGESSTSPVLFTTSTQVKPSSECKELQPQQCSVNLRKEYKLEPKSLLSQSQVEALMAVKEVLVEVPSGRSPTGEPLPATHFDCGVQSATAVSGIEAPDLTSLLEQFEETQAKEERVETFMEPVKPLHTSDSPENPKTLRNLPCIQMSEGVDIIPEPLGNEIILGRQQDLPARRKNPPSKAIQIIDPRPLPFKKIHNNLPEFPVSLASPHSFSSISSDHDYCRSIVSSLTHIPQRSMTWKLRDVSKTSELQKTMLESGSAPECKQTSTFEVSTTIIRPATSVTQHLPEESRARSNTALSESAATEQAFICAAEHKMGQCTLPTPPPSPPVRGRDRRRYRRRSPRSGSSCSSCSSTSSSSCCSQSRSPKRQKCHRKRSESSSCSSSPSHSISHSPPRDNRWSHSRARCSRSRSRSWSRSRSPSRSPAARNRCRQWRNVYSSRESKKLRREHELRIQKLKAIDERRVVYVGRICRSMTHDELRERFSQFGEVECVSLHFRERGDHYGFVTFYKMNDAFSAIDNGSKLRRPDELPFDLCFGGRRQFCNSDYADLDANKDTDLSSATSKPEDLDFDQLLKQAQRGLKR